VGLVEGYTVKNSIVRRPQAIDDHVGAIEEFKGCPCIVQSLVIGSVRHDC